MTNLNVTSKLVVPLAIWGQQAPTHCISCLELTPDQTLLATGSNDGQICLWHVDNDMSLQPRTMLFGHTAAVTCITMTTYDNNVSHLVSASDNGEISLWDCKDGLCLESRKTTYTHTAIKSHQMLNSREHKIICNGTYSEIQILDALSLRIMVRLTARIQSNWISALCVLRPVKQEADVIVAMSNSGTVKVWALSSDLSSNTLNSSIAEDESKQLRCLGAQTLTCCPYNQRTVLIVCSKYWQIYDAGDFSLLCSESCRRGNRWLGGDFIAIDRVIVFSNEGRAYLYQLPTNLLRGKALYGLTTDIDTAPGNPRSATQAGPQVYMMLDVNVELSLERLRCAPVMKYFLGTRDIQTQLCIRGDSQGRVIIWKIAKSEKKIVRLARQESVDKLPAITPIHVSRLRDSWSCNSNTSRVEGFIDYLNKSTDPEEDMNDQKNLKKVTSSIYIETYGTLVFGRSDGSLVSVDALDCIAAQLFGEDKEILESNVIIAHSGAVTCILHPYSCASDTKRYARDLLVTGGADFTVNLWSMQYYQLLYTFTVHGGEITQLITPPSDCNARILPAICSVASDHSVALLNVKEYKCLLFASRHLFSVETIKWRPSFDFLVVLCTDGTVYVWQMETGHLDRVAHGVIGKDIVAACNSGVSDGSGGGGGADSSPSSSTSTGSSVTSYVSSSSDDPRNRDRTDSLSEPGEISISQAFRRRNIATFRNLAQQHLKRSTGNEKSNNPNPSNLPHPSVHQFLDHSPMTIHTLETNFNDPLAHIIYFDIEALIVQLLNDEYVRLKLTEYEEIKMADDINTPTTTGRKMSEDLPSSLTYVMKIARLVTSVLHGWGLDDDLDKVCARKLGLIQPSVDVSFGIISRSGHMSLLLPGWSTQRHQVSHEMERNTSKHWQISESLTTRHLLAVISLANTLMGMSTSSFLPSINDTKCLDPNLPRYTGDVPSDNSEATVNQAQTKQGWSMLAALHCVLLPDMVGGQLYSPPQIEILVRRWQDRCLEIREASQALLLAELRRIGSKGRDALAEVWCTRIPGDSNHCGETLSSIIGADPLRPPPVATSLTAVVAKDEDEDQKDYEDFEDLMLGSCKSITSSLSGETRRRQASAIVLMSVLGAEFGDVISGPSQGQQSPGTQPLVGFGINDYSSARLTSNALSFLLLQPISLCLPAHTALRRAAVDLIGRGFTVWEPYLDVSAVLMAILRLCVDADVLVPSLPISLPLCARADCCRSARHALSLIATSRPLAFITAMAKEVARHNARISGQPLGHSSSGHSLTTSLSAHHMGGGGSGGGVGGGASSSHNFSATPLVKSKSEILRIVELLIEKIPNDICDLMMEVMDITLHCVDSSAAKVHGLKETFPPIFKFSNVAYCPETKKACVGARNGSIAFYDLKHSKTQITLLAGHKGPVSAVAFSPQGRYATSFSLADDKLLFWQLASTSLFGIGSQPTKCVRSYSTPALELPASTSRVRRVRLVWIDSNTCVLLAADGSEARYRI